MGYSEMLGSRLTVLCFMNGYPLELSQGVPSWERNSGGKQSSTSQLLLNTLSAGSNEMELSKGNRGGCPLGYISLPVSSDQILGAKQALLLRPVRVRQNKAGGRRVQGRRLPE